MISLLFYTLLCSCLLLSVFVCFSLFAIFSNSFCFVCLVCFPYFSLSFSTSVSCLIMSDFPAFLCLVLLPHTFFLLCTPCVLLCFFILFFLSSLILLFPASLLFVSAWCFIGGWLDSNTWYHQQRFNRKPSLILFPKCPLQYYWDKLAALSRLFPSQPKTW